MFTVRCFLPPPLATTYTYILQDTPVSQATCGVASCGCGARYDLTMQPIGCTQTIRLAAANANLTSANVERAEEAYQVFSIAR